jgi:hypothetical protein
MRMAKAVGFFVIPIERQYIQGVDEAALTEVRSELGMLDLAQQQAPDERLVKFFTTHIPNVIARTVDDWAAIGSALSRSGLSFIRKAMSVREADSCTPFG